MEVPNKYPIEKSLGKFYQFIFFSQGLRVIKKKHENSPLPLRMLTNQNFIKVFFETHVEEF